MKRIVDYAGNELRYAEYVLTRAEGWRDRPVVQRVVAAISAKRRCCPLRWTLTLTPHEQACLDFVIRFGRLERVLTMGDRPYVRMDVLP